MPGEIHEAFDKLCAVGVGMVVLDSFIAFSDDAPGYEQLQSRAHAAVAEARQVWGEPTTWMEDRLWLTAEWHVAGHIVVAQLIPSCVDTRLSNTRLEWMLTVRRQTPATAT
jgi:hypothetical protein